MKVEFKIIDNNTKSLNTMNPLHEKVTLYSKIMASLLMKNFLKMLVQGLNCKILNVSIYS